MDEMKQMKNPHERGQALILIALAIVGIIGMVALAVDGGNAYAERRRAQNAADASALAGALAKIRNGNISSTSLTQAASDGYNNNGTTNTVVVNNGPASGPYANNTDYVQVIITAKVNTYFGKIIGITQITNQVQAVAHAKPGIPPSGLTGNAIVGLTDECKAIEVQGNGGTVITGGGLYANGKDCDHNNAIFNNSSSAWMQASCYNAVGGINANPGSLTTTSGNPCYNQGTAVTPLPPLVLPNPQCNGTAQVVNGDTMTPGTYSSPHNFPPNGVHFLQSGIYCVDSGVSIQEDLSGNGVVIVVTGGSVTTNGNANISLHAPTEGHYSGLLFYMPESNSSSFTINGSSSVNMTGMILGPTAQITINGDNSSQFNLSSQLIGAVVKLTGNAGINLNYNSGDQFQIQVYPQVELVQ
jgi:Flp pilus assembly protein TadG